MSAVTHHDEFRVGERRVIRPGTWFRLRNEPGFFRCSEIRTRNGRREIVAWHVVGRGAGAREQWRFLPATEATRVRVRRIHLGSARPDGVKS